MTFAVESGGSLSGGGTGRVGGTIDGDRLFKIKVGHGGEILP